ncbi:hypothetical protein N7467_006613 [Penicillium canescens]|nr:hypothetical protein N7467_006613 [Penicillium canescens]
MPPSGLATVRGAVLSDIKVDDALPTMRGKPLTPAQEAVLWSLYLRHVPARPGDKLPGKKFWCDLALKFLKQTGRTYSWLSVKRRIVALLGVHGVLVDWGPKQVRSPLPVPGSPEVAVQSGRGLTDDDGGKERLEPGSVREEHRDLDDSHLSQRPTVNQRLARFQSSKVKPQNASAPEKRTGVVRDWLKRTYSTSLPDESDDAESRPGSQSPCPVQSRSSAITKIRARSRSPQFDKHHVYRNRSPGLRGRTELVSKRLQDQLASARTPRTESRKRQIPDIPGPEWSRRSDPQVVISKRRSPLKSNSAHDSFESIYLAPHTNGAGIPRKSKSGQPATLDLPSSDNQDEDGLPQTPVRILRRCRVAK